MQYLTQDAITTIGFSKAVEYRNDNKDIFSVLQTSEFVLLPAHMLYCLNISLHGQVPTDP